MLGLLQLVDESGVTVGHLDKLAAHENGGALHRAISVLLVNSKQEVLIQRRARGKYHFAGLWANSCCSHPLGEESALDAAARTLERELGIQTGLKEVGVVIYEATDSSSGLTEREYDHVFLGNWDSEVHPNPTELDEVRWISINDLTDEIDQNPSDFAPWLTEILNYLEDKSLRSALSDWA